jgi:ribosome-associated translation inhibitor RaiA
MTLAAHLAWNQRESVMQVLVNSDHHITGSESVAARVEGIVHDAMDRFGERVTRVEVHLTDVNGAKLGDRDKRCMMEARLSGLKPIAVSHQAPTLLEAIDEAADKLQRAVDRIIGKLRATEIRGAPDARIASLEELQALEKTESNADVRRR